MEKVGSMCDLVLYDNACHSFLITKTRSIITKRFLKWKNSWRRWDIYPNNTPLSPQPPCYRFLLPGIVQ
jgi:hypothetical protein